MTTLQPAVNTKSQCTLWHLGTCLIDVSVGVERSCGKDHQVSELEEYPSPAAHNLGFDAAATEKLLLIIAYRWRNITDVSDAWLHTMSEFLHILPESTSTSVILLDVAFLQDVPWDTLERVCWTRLPFSWILGCCMTIKTWPSNPQGLDAKQVCYSNKTVLYSSSRGRESTDGKCMNRPH